MSDNTITRTLKYEADFPESELNRLIRAFDNLDDQFKDTNDLLVFQDKLMSGQVRTIKEVQDAFSKLGKESSKELGKVVAQLEAIDEQAGKTSLDLADEANSEARNRAGIIGDASSSLGAIGSATGIGALQGAGDLLGTVESVAQLKGAFVGLPASIGAVVTALGPVGVGLIAVLGLAAVAIKVFADSVDRYTGEIADRAEGRLRVTDDIINGLTTEQAEDRIKKLQERMEAYNEVLEASQKDYEELLKTAGDNSIWYALTKQFAEY